jgi:hypothetical protein
MSLTICPILALGEAPPSSAKMPGKGAAQHPFLYAGEWDTRKPLEQSIFMVRDGKSVWQYSIPLHPSPGGESVSDQACHPWSVHRPFRHYSFSSWILRMTFMIPK